MRMRLSKHFVLDEFICKCGCGVPSEFKDEDQEIIANLKRLANEVLEPLRTALGNSPLMITSGYRCPRYNRRVGGAKNSFHLKGLAADVVSKHKSPAEVHRVALQLQKAGKIGGVGLYKGFTHVDLGPKRTWRGDQR